MSVGVRLFFRRAGATGLLLHDVDLFVGQMSTLRSVFVGRALIGEALYYGLEQIIGLYLSCIERSLRMRAVFFMMSVGVRLFLRRAGDKGPLLLILHGLLGSSDNWLSMSHQLAAAPRRVWLPDARNHGRSPHTSSHRIEDMVEDLLELLDMHQIDEIDLMGHSMGGKVALACAATAPRRIRRLIIVDISARAYDQRENERLLRGLLQLPVTQAHTRQAIDEDFRKIEPSSVVRNFLLKNLERHRAGGFRWRPNLRLLLDELPYYLGALELPRMAHPSLLIRGTSSTYVQRADLSALQKVLPNLHVEDLPTGHWPHAEQPNLFAEIVDKFLSKA